MVTLLFLNPQQKLLGILSFTFPLKRVMVHWWIIYIFMLHANIWSFFVNSEAWYRKSCLVTRLLKYRLLIYKLEWTSSDFQKISFRHVYKNCTCVLTLRGNTFTEFPLFSLTMEHLTLFKSYSEMCYAWEVSSNLFCFLSGQIIFR